jgi:hypothetical protein
MPRYGFPAGSLDAIGPVHGPRHPMVMCPRCRCCSLREPTDPTSCNGECEPCGHHPECADCADFSKRRQRLGDLARDFAEALKDFDAGRY